MSVATMLGVDDLHGPTMRAARTRWKAWSATEPPLAVVDELVDLPGWVRMAPRAERDAPLRSLAKLGSRSGGDEPLATTALCWMLVPGAAVLAHRLSDLSGHIDELVASHLWTSARSFSWERPIPTAASILRSTRRAVLTDAGVGEWARREDRAWASSVCVDPSSAAWEYLTAPELPLDPRTELLDLLDDAASAGVITSADRMLLVELAIVASELAERGGAAARKSRAGLCSRAATEAISARWGMSTRSVRRRAARSIDRLSTFSAHHGEELTTAVSARDDLAPLMA